MIRTAAILIVLAFALCACIPPHHLHAPPGQVKKATGIHPTSGKVKVKVK